MIAIGITIQLQVVLIKTEATQMGQLNLLDQSKPKTAGPYNLVIGRFMFNCHYLNSLVSFQLYLKIINSNLL